MRFDEHTHYWLTLHPHAHIRSEGDALLLYNSVTGSLRWWPDAPRLATLGRRLLATDPTPLIRVSGADLADDDALREFVTAVVENFTGDLVDVGLSDGEPLQTMPLIRDAYVEDPRAIAPVELIRELTVYVNAECGVACDCCMFAHRQATGCGIFDGAPDELPLQHLGRMIEELGERPIPITVTGGNVLRYSQYEPMLDLLEPRTTSARMRLSVHMDNLVDDRRGIEQAVGRGLSLSVVVPWAFRRPELSALATAVRAWGADVQFIFRVRSNADVARAQHVIDDLEPAKVRLAPCFTGENTSFFEADVFLSVERLIEHRPSLSAVHANAVLNRLGFGRLVVRSSGEICASEATEPLGTVADCTLAEAARHEIETGNVWLETRGGVEPCRRCVFSGLCPPLSRYEYAIGRNNLCHMWNGKTASGTEQRTQR